MLAVWEFVCVIWNWIGSNSGQIQILIAVVALIYAWKAYHKVLHQIEISDRQTNLTIDQMTKYNKERAFELRLRLKIRISEHFKTLMELQDACNDLSLRLQELSIDTQTNHPSSFEAVEAMIKGFKSSISLTRDLISEKISENSSYIKSISATSDLFFIEEILDKVEQNQDIYNSKIREMKSINLNIENIWLPMKFGVNEAILRKNDIS